MFISIKIVAWYKYYWLLAKYIIPIFLCTTSGTLDKWKYFFKLINKKKKKRTHFALDEVESLNFS